MLESGLPLAQNAQLKAENEQLRKRATVEQNKLEIRCGTQTERVRELEAGNAHIKAQLAKQTQEVKRLKAVFDSIKS